MGCACSGSSDTFESQYEMLAAIGTGSYATVRSCQKRSTGEMYAVKCFTVREYTQKQRDLLRREVTMMQKLSHPNVVHIERFYEGEVYCYLVMELITGGELFTRIVEKTKFSEASAQQLFKTLTETVKYCHDQGVVHRDLKPENILMSDLSDSATIKVADFGLATVFDHAAGSPHLATRCGTPGYTAPEVLMRQKYGLEVDVWSLGVILYILLCGYPPFNFRNHAQLVNQIKTARYEFDPEGWDGISDSAKDLVSRILVVDPTVRYTTQQILDHPWVSGNVSLPDKPLVATIARIKRFNARRRLRAGFSAVRMAVRVRRLASAANGSATPDLGLPGPPSTSFTRLPACMITPPTRKRTLSADAVNDVMWAPAVLAAGGAGSVPVLPPPGPPPPTAIKASSANSHKGHHHHHHPRSLGHRTSTDPKSNPASLSPGGFSLIPSTPSQRSSAWYRLRRALHAVLGSVRFRNGPQRRPSETSSEDGVAAAAAVAATGDVPPSVSPTEELLDTSSVLLTATTVN